MMVESQPVSHPMEAGTKSGGTSWHLECDADGDDVGVVSFVEGEF